MNRLTQLALVVLGFGLLIGCSILTKPGNPLAFDFLLTFAGVVGFIAGVAGLVSDT